MNSGVFDVIIAGAGPAGMSAALWAHELGLSYRLLESGTEAGGQLLNTFNKIDNHLGLVAANGRDMRDRFLQQLKERTIDITASTAVSRIDFPSKQAVITADTIVSFKTFVLCTGVRRRKLGIPGENEFRERGILFSGKRDAKKTKGKTAVVVGGGDAAFENALILADFASEVILIHRRSEFTARSEFVSSVLSHPEIRVLENTELTAIEGDGSVERISIKDSSGAKTVLDAGAVVIRIGVAPNNELVSGFVELDKKGYVHVDSEGRTSCMGVYAAGDVANPNSPTISSAVGMGATAIKSIHRLLTRN